MDTPLTTSELPFTGRRLLLMADIRSDVLNLQAMGLNVLDIAFAGFFSCGDVFSVLKAFEVQNVLEPFLAPAASATWKCGIRVNEQNHRFLSKTSGRHTGCGRTAMLFYTVVTLVAKIEDALNQIWRLPIPTWSQRVTAYLSVILVGPVMVFTALTLTAFGSSSWLVSGFRDRIVSYLFTLTPASCVCPCFAPLSHSFTSSYPIPKVRLSSALVGGASQASYAACGRICAFVATPPVRGGLFEFCHRDWCLSFGCIPDG